MKGEVQVYRNLNKKGSNGEAIYSVRNSDGIVEDHSSCVVLTDCKLRVSQKGNQRVRDEKRKNVHAYIQGKRLESEERNGRMGMLGYLPYQKGYDWWQLTYNPYKNETFVAHNIDWDDNQIINRPVFAANRVVIDNHIVWAQLPNKKTLQES